MDARRVDAVLDVVCVWSCIAYTRLRRVLEEYRADGGEVAVTFRPFQVEPDIAVDGGPLSEHLHRHFGSSARRRMAEVAELGRQDGLTLAFDKAVRTNTFDAHRLVAASARLGRAEAMVTRLFRAHFTDGRNIGDTAVLTELAAEIGVPPLTDGVDAEGVRAELDRVRRSGIEGVPVFRAGPVVLAGLHSDDDYRQLLTQT